MSVGDALPGGPHVLRDYALLADGERGAVLSPRGEIAWMCFPGWADAPVFSSLLGGPSRYQLSPVGRFVWGGQYDDGSLVWRNRWVLEGSGIVECTEALAFPGCGERAVLVRRLRVLRGRAEVDVVLQLDRAPRDRSAPRFHRTDRDLWECRWSGHALRWCTPVEPHRHGGALGGRITLEEDRPVDLVLELSTGGLDEAPPDVGEVLTASRVAWREGAPDLDVMAGRDVRHSLAVLRGLTTADGAMVAAATTSLPERANEGRDYDYRYVWLRDQCYAGQALAAAAAVDGTVAAQLERPLAFVTERVLEHGTDLRPAYRTDGAEVPPVQPLDLPGYPGAPDVATGNRAGRRFQLDVFGEVLQLLAAASGLDLLQSDGWAAADLAVAAVAERWREPDSGIWELSPAHHTSSRLSCVAGLRAMAARMPPGGRTNDLLQLADAIAARTSREGLHPSGRWQRTPTDARCDAALLLPAIRGAVPVHDPRSVSTRRAVEEELCVDGYVYRFRASDEPLGRAEGAFLLCGYWSALAADAEGDRESALRHFERTRAASGPAGLYTEEFDVHQRQLRGNFPQAFVHALLVETAVALTASG